MTEMPSPRKHPSHFQPGEEFEPVQYTVTRQMVDYLLIGINDRHPWYMEGSPFGRPIAPPLMVQMAAIRLQVKHLWGDFVGAKFTEPAGLHYVFDAEYHEPVFVGETITVRGRCLANRVARGRQYVDYETTVHGDDGRLCARYVSTSLPQFRREGE